MDVFFGFWFLTRELLFSGILQPPQSSHGWTQEERQEKQKQENQSHPMSKRLFNMTVGTKTGLYCLREWERPCCSTRICSHLTRGHQEHCLSNQWLFWYYAVVCMVNSHPWLFSAIGEVEQKLGTKQVNSFESPPVLKQLYHLRSRLLGPQWLAAIYLIVPIYVVFTADLWAVLPCLKSTGSQGCLIF